jgi:hypothetical protein
MCRLGYGGLCGTRASPGVCLLGTSDVDPNPDSSDQYEIQMCVANLLLCLQAFLKLIVYRSPALSQPIRHWWPRQSRHEGGSSDIASSSQECINAEEVQPSPQYPDSLHKSENDVVPDEGYEANV